MQAQFPRPTLQSEETCQIAARRLIADPLAKEEWFDDVALAIQNARNTFDALKELDDMGWEISDEIIESFLGLNEIRAIALYQAIEAWVGRHGVIAQLQPGSMHKVKISGAMRDVVIAEIYDSRAQYRVVYSVPDKTGLQEAFVNFEVLHDLATPPERFQLSCC